MMLVGSNVCENQIFFFELGSKSPRLRGITPQRVVIEIYRFVALIDGHAMRMAVAVVNLGIPERRVSRNSCDTCQERGTQRQQARKKQFFPLLASASPNIAKMQAQIIPVNDVEKRALDALDEEGLITCLQELIRIPSVSGTKEENDAQRWFAEKMRQSGLEVDLWNIPIPEVGL